MPVEPIFVDTTIVAAGARLPATGNLAIIGQDAGGTQLDNVVAEVTSLAQAQTLFGTTTDIAQAAAEAFAQKIEKAFIVRATKTNVPAEATLAGVLTTLANNPLSGTSVFSFGDATTPVLVFTVPSANGEINTRAGTCFTTGITTINYDFTAWTAALDALANFTGAKMNIIVLADAPAGEEFDGDLNDIRTRSDTERWVIPMQGGGADVASAIVTAIATQHPSRNVVGMAAKETTKDIAAAVGGALSVIDPWEKLMWKTLLGIIQTTFFTKTDVETTLEGGKVNAIITKVSQMIASDGLTTDTGTTYKYIDITRTQYYIEGLIRVELENLIRTARVPYTPAGIEAVRVAITDALETAVFNTALREPFVNADGQIQKGYTIDVPVFADISAADKTARKLDNVFITAFLAGHIQTISMNLTIQL